jgi:hypothetical protein
LPLAPAHKLSRDFRPLLCAPLRSALMARHCDALCSRLLGANVRCERAALCTHPGGVGWLLRGASIVGRLALAPARWVILGPPAPPQWVLWSPTPIENFRSIFALRPIIAFLSPFVKSKICAKRFRLSFAFLFVQFLCQTFRFKGPLLSLSLARTLQRQGFRFCFAPKL